MLQHIVPQHHLKGFCDQQPSKRQGRVVWELRLKENVVQPRSPKNVGRLRDYYSIPRGGGGPDPAIESELSMLESHAAPLIARLRTGRVTLTDEERGWLAGFMAFQMVRGPAFRDHVEAATATAGQLMMRAMGRRPDYLARIVREVPELKNKAWTPDEIEFLAEKAAAVDKHFKIITSPHVSLGMIHIAKDLVRPLAVMRWEFLYAGGRERFVTSDAPVTQWNPHPPGLGPGLEVAGTEVTFPISPRICLRARRDRGPDPTQAVGG